VPEAHSVAIRNKHAAVQALAYCGERLARGLDEKAHLEAPAEHGSRGKDLPPRPREPGHPRQHRVPHGRWHPLGACCQHLGHIERVSARPLVHLAGVQRRARMIQQLPHAGDSERGNPHPDDARQRGEISQHNGERVIAAHLLRPECRKDHEPGTVQPAAHEAQDLQCRLVSPLDVLEHEQCRRLRQHAAHVPEQPKPADACLGVQHPGEFGQGVHERTQCFGRRDVVGATAPDDMPRGRVGQGSRERRLADASFPAQKDQPAAARQRVAEQPLQRRQEILPLDQHIHHSTLG
jgi:hypothetical protein